LRLPRKQGDEYATFHAGLRVVDRLGTFTYRSKFSTWLLQVARHAGVDALRARETDATGWPSDWDRPHPPRAG
jgi:DNA-directed RNA polymerase specialized sigma24 family protein